MNYLILPIGEPTSANDIKQYGIPMLMDSRYTPPGQNYMLGMIPDIIYTVSSHTCAIGSIVKAAAISSANNITVYLCAIANTVGAEYDACWTNARNDSVLHYRQLSYNRTLNSGQEVVYTSFGPSSGSTVELNPELPTYTTSDEVFAAFDDGVWENNDDPYGPGGGSGPGGGDGEYELDSDDIDFDNLPSLSAVDAGFINIYNPSLTQLQDLANYLWGNLFDVNQLKKMFSNPMDAILGLSIVPVTVPNLTNPSEITVGNIPTGLYAYKASTQYVIVDCGSLTVKKYWGAYLDYEPYTKFELYLPFIGTVKVSADDIMGKTITIKYYVDVLTGSCVAKIKCGSTILYQFNGQCAANIPISATDWSSTISSIIQMVAKIGMGASSYVSGAVNDNPSSIINGAAMHVSAASNVLSMKPNIERSGTFSASTGLLGLRKPYLIRTTPRQCVPINQNKYTGYPSYIKRKLSSVTGFTRVAEMRLENIHCTDSELQEIETLLRTGVIV